MILDSDIKEDAEGNVDIVKNYLYYYEGYSANEIAQLLGEKPATVATQLSRGREKLRTHLEQEGFA